MKKNFVFCIFVCFVLSACFVEVKQNDVKNNDVVKPSDEGQEDEVIPEAIDIVSVDDFSIDADSVLVDNTDVGFNYSAEMINDKDFSTAWCVQSGKKLGVLTFTFNDYVKASKFGIVPGFARDEKVNSQNNRIKTLKLVFDDGKYEKTFDLQDTYGMQFLKFDEERFKKVDFVIEDVYQGNKYEDTCIAEIDFKSDYVLNEDKDAALNYYKKYKADFALRPYDIISKIVVSDVENDECGRPVYPDVSRYAYKMDGDGVLTLFTTEIYVTGLVNQYGKEGDKLDVKWYFYLPEIDAIYMEKDLSLYSHWDLVADYKTEVVNGCDGNFYAPVFMETPDNYEEENGVWPLGQNKVQFFKDGKIIGSQTFNIIQ